MNRLERLMCPCVNNRIRVPTVSTKYNLTMKQVNRDSLQQRTREQARFEEDQADDPEVEEPPIWPRSDLVVHLSESVVYAFAVGSRAGFDLKSNAVAPCSLIGSMTQLSRSSYRRVQPCRDSRDKGQKFARISQGVVGSMLGWRERLSEVHDSLLSRLSTCRFFPGTSARVRTRRAQPQPEGKGQQSANRRVDGCSWHCLQTTSSFPVHSLSAHQLKWSCRTVPG